MPERHLDSNFSSGANEIPKSCSQTPLIIAALCLALLVAVLGLACAR